ncbi:hypothetical protein BJX66DRAFT_301393 [Aspergillus keveii]|uniref:F-box domain-containing protein n=1 Tax=Aspergillus keveii TaxID=714993 RepID=A0ABR4G975_9EURO
MAHRLPVELWTQIAFYLKDGTLSLPTYARVCRQWQLVFERLIYQNLKVASEGSEVKRGVIPLSLFRSLMSGSSQYRRAFVNWLQYTITTPHDIEYYRAMKLENRRYSERNAIRDANDRAFSTAICSLFEILEPWEANLKVTLSISVRGRDKMLEPETKEVEDLVQWQTIRDGEQWVIPPYHARFPERGPDMPRIACIGELLFEDNYLYQGIWSGATLQIAERCVALQRLYVDLEEWVRPDHITYIRERRQGVASALPRLPPTLRSFELKGNTEEPWSNILPGLDLLAGRDLDELSLNLRNLSLTLRHLKLSVTAVAMDFLFPLDDNCSPTSDTSALHWPYLESLTLEALPMCLPSGEWLFDYELHPDEEQELPDPTTGLDIFDNELMQEEAEFVRHKMRIEHFHRLFISLGHAAQRMPAIKVVRTSMIETPSTTLDFNSGRGATDFEGTKPTLKFESQSGYKPDERVAAAWRFSLDDLEVEDRGPENLIHVVQAKVTLDRVPGDE